jgi:hypothetical protein
MQILLEAAGKNTVEEMGTYNELRVNVTKMRTCQISVISNTFVIIEVENFTHSLDRCFWL